MYNNAIIQTNYKPYMPLPKKRVVSSEEKSSQEKASKENGQQPVVTPNNYSSYAENKQPSSDSFTHSNIQATQKININQVLIDFNSTLNAIGASEDVETEVKTYLGLVENQAQKDNPNKKMIVSNLKIAADVLDTYISDTLKKPSKVVKEWVDALLLQNIDFKADNNITKGAFEAITGECPQTAKLAEKKLAQKELEKKSSAQIDIKPEKVNESNSQENINSEVAVSVLSDESNSKINTLIAQAKHIKNSSPKEALETLSNAFNIAQTISDKSSVAKIYSEIADVQNELNHISKALDCLNASTILAYSLDNDELKSDNHKKMGSIYSDAGYLLSALDHYYASIAIDGNLDDTDSQANTLNAIGNIYSSQYMKDESINSFKNALALAKVKSNLDTMSDSFIGTAETFHKFGENNKAMNNLKNAAILSEKNNNTEYLADIYEKAGDLLIEKNHSKKAADLYKKSYRLAEKLSNNESVERLKEKLLCIAA